MTIQERIQALEGEIADRERIIRAPLELAELQDRRARLEHLAERKAEIAEAIRVDPEWPRKLAEARVAVAEAQAAVDAHELARSARLRSPRRRFGHEVDRGNVLEGATPEAVETSAAAGMSIPIGSGEGLYKAGLAMRFLPTPALPHKIAQEQLDLARAYLKRLERWPHLYALDKLQAANAGQTTEELIASTPRVRFGRVRGFIPRRGEAGDGAA